MRDDYSMADDSVKDSASNEVFDVSPGAGFQVFVEMANLHNKLKLLNYDDEYVLKWRMKPISRIQFAVPTNPGDQLHAFIALSSWLFQKGGVRFDKPSEVSTHPFIHFTRLFLNCSISRTTIKVFFFKTSSHNSRNS